MSASRFRPPGSPPSMLGGLTHELRTPLNSILMMAELLLESLDRDGSEASKDRELRYARNISRAVRDVLELVDQAGELGRIEAGRTPPAARAVAVADLARRIEAAAEPGGSEEEDEAEPRPAIDVRVEPDAPREVATDPARLLRAVELLLASASRVSGEGPVTVRLGARRDAPDDSAPTSALGSLGTSGLTVTITDAGPPCAREESQRLFVPFGAPDPRSVRRHGGTGLGLSVAWALARLLEGELTAEPAGEDGGCRFVLSLPELGH